jgi:hypothetical protein
MKPSPDSKRSAARPRSLPVLLAALKGLRALLQKQAWAGDRRLTDVPGAMPVAPLPPATRPDADVFDIDADDDALEALLQDEQDEQSEEPDATEEAALPNAQRELDAPAAGSSKPAGGGSAYSGALRRIPKLTLEEELCLGRRARAGDRAAEQRLVLHNLHIVPRIARTYTAPTMAMDDLIEEGNLGLMHAATKFDPEREVFMMALRIM